MSVLIAPYPLCISSPNNSLLIHPLCCPAQRDPKQSFLRTTESLRDEVVEDVAAEVLLDPTVDEEGIPMVEITIRTDVITTNEVVGTGRTVVMAAVAGIRDRTILPITSTRGEEDIRIHHTTPNSRIRKINTMPHREVPRLTTTVDTIRTVVDQHEDAVVHLGAVVTLTVNHLIPMVAATTKAEATTKLVVITKVAGIIRVADMVALTPTPTPATVDMAVVTTQAGKHRAPEAVDTEEVHLEVVATVDLLGDGVEEDQDHDINACTFQTLSVGTSRFSVYYLATIFLSTLLSQYGSSNTYITQFFRS